MGKKLLQLIEQLVDREDVGTLFLGRGDRVRHVFFAGDEVHLVDAGREGRFVPAPHLLKQGTASRAALSELMTKIAQEGTAAGVALESAGVLDDDKVAEYRGMEMLEEILLVLDRSGEHYLFESENVPEALLVPGADHVAISNQDLIRAMRVREQERLEIADILPRLDEKLVLSERGIATLSDDRHWVFGEIGQLVDGFRSVQQILEESLFFPHRTLIILCAAARQGWVRKTLFRELEDVRLDQLDATTGHDLARRYQQAAEMSVDDVPIRERLVELLEHLSQPGQACHQLEIIGDTLLGRGDLDRAIETYEAGLALDAENAQLKEKLFGLVFERAEQSIESDRQSEARELLETCLRYRPNEIELYELILETYGDDEPTVSREALRMVESMRKERAPLGRRILVSALERFPSSVSLRRRQVNFVLDDGDTEGAIVELRVLARQLKQVGQNAEAQEIQKKIERLSPTVRDDLGSGAVGKKRRRWRPSWAALFVCSCLLAFGVYQHNTYLALEDYRTRFAALASADIPTPGTTGFRQEQQRTRNFVDELRSFLDGHPVTIWAPMVQRAILSAEERLFYLDSSSRREFDRLLQTGISHEERGQFDRAEEWYALLIERGRATVWEAEAKDRLETLRKFRSEARRLYEDGERLRAAGDFEGCFEAFSVLLLDYSRAPEMKRIRLPYKVVSKPGGAEVLANGELVGPTPVIVHVNPFEPMEIEVIFGSKVVRRRIENALEHEFIVEKY